MLGYLGLVLDEYLWGLVPGSLLLTGGHVIVVGLVAVVIARVLLGYLDGVVDGEEEKEKKG